MFWQMPRSRNRDPGAPGKFIAGEIFFHVRKEPPADRATVRLVGRNRVTPMIANKFAWLA